MYFIVQLLRLHSRQAAVETIARKFSILSFCHPQQPTQQLTIRITTSATTSDFGRTGFAKSNRAFFVDAQWIGIVLTDRLISRHIFSALRGPSVGVFGGAVVFEGLQSFSQPVSQLGSLSVCVGIKPIISHSGNPFVQDVAANSHSLVLLLLLLRLLLMLIPTLLFIFNFAHPNGM